MKARSVARELALLTLFQSENQGETLHELTLNAVRTLQSIAQEQIRVVSEEIADLEVFLTDHEIMHPDNETIPVDDPTRPVPIPTTQEMGEKLGRLLQSVQQLEEALYLPEVLALAEREDVQNYCTMLIKLVKKHLAELDQKINDAATDWKVERFHKMDLTLLRLAVAELTYGPNVDAATVIDETLELAKQYTTDESRKFIHGILGAIAGSPEEEISRV